MANYRKGDVNMDGLITSEDRDLIREYVYNNGTLTDEQLLLADIDGDGEVSTYDVILASELVDAEKVVYGLTDSGKKEAILTNLKNDGHGIVGIMGSTQSDGSIKYPEADEGGMALGSETIAGPQSFAQGNKAKATGYCSSAVGSYATASGDYSCANGSSVTASGARSHAEGMSSGASADSAHAEGMYAYAHAKASHAEGFHTSAESEYQHVQGQYNIEDYNNKYAHIIGNGRPNESGVVTRSNAHTVDWDGNAWYQGDLRIGGTKYDDATSLTDHIEWTKEVDDKFNYIGGRNYLDNAYYSQKMVQPTENYNQYSYYVNHPMVNQQSSQDHYYTLSFKFFPTGEGYTPAQSIVVGGLKSGDAWAVRRYMGDFRVEQYKNYQIWSLTFKIPGNNDEYLADHIRFILESSGGPYGGTVEEIKLEEGKVRTDWSRNPTNYPAMRMYKSAYVGNETVTIEGVTAAVSLVVSYHTSHGSCGSAHLLFRGVDTGSSYTTLAASEHCQLQSYDGNNLVLNGDTWGAYCQIFALVE